MAEFLDSNLVTLESRLAERHEALYLQRAATSQKTAWRDELVWLRASFESMEEVASWGVVLEYELPFEGGRRPDVVVLARDRMLVLEFKESYVATQAHVDQAIAYAHDLEEFHSACRGRQVLPVVVMPRAGEINESWEGVSIIGPSFLPKTLRTMAGHGQQTSVGAFVNGTYDPLPTLVEAARRVFRDQPLPSIKSVENAGIDLVIAWLEDLVQSASVANTRHLVLITGVPGSGKTLVGLKFVHEVSPGSSSQVALFLSGNDPLVDVLQNALGDEKVFVKRMHNFILEYGVRARALPGQHVLVFDEAQRAWDQRRMAEKKGLPRSEPEILLDIASRLHGWAVVVGLVGEGQEIHAGEEAGLEQWLAAVTRASGRFQIHVPPRLLDSFAGQAVDTREQLDLTASLRTLRAERAQDWVRSVIDNDLVSAATIASALRKEESHYELYVTDDLEMARSHVRERYDGELSRRYGLLASSKAKNLRSLGVDNEFGATQRVKIARWFNAEPHDPDSCCQLRQPVTEFQCQGLELDMPVLCWGDDLRWDGTWKSYGRTRGSLDNHKLRLNSYRVLLSRGRDGLIVWVPENLKDDQSQVIMTFLLDAGALPLGPSMS